MDSSKTQKKRKKSPKWMVTDVEDHNVKISDSNKFSANEKNSCAAAVNNTVHQNDGNLANKQKRKLKRHCSEGLKKSKLQSIQDNDLDDDINEIEYVNGVVNEVNELNKDLVTINRSDDLLDDENEEVEDSGKGEDLDQYDKENEITEKQSNTQTKTKQRNNILSVDDDIETMISKMLPSDSESDVSSMDFNEDSKLSESEYTKNYHYRRLDEKLYDLYNMYKIEDDYKYIVHLPHNAKFHFQGKLQITLLYGDIRVFGYRLKSSSSKNLTFEMYSPRHCMQLCIKAMRANVCEDQENVLKMIQSKFKLSKSNHAHLFEHFNKFDSLIVVERLFDKCSLILNHYCDNDIFLEKEIMLKGNYEEQKLGCFLDKFHVFERKRFTQGCLWSNIKPKKCTIICGGKGVGKSTLLKYLINSKLSWNDAVLCIDLDPGQTEFTMPGCVSGIVCKKPLLGPNFTNITTPAKLAYIGDVNVALDPVKYMKAVNYIIESCRQDPELMNLRWFVNTMGFNKGIGMDIMINIIKLIQPDTVVQISSSDNTRNYEIQLNPELVQNHPVLSLVPLKDINLNYELHMLKSCSKTKGIGFQSGYKPAELREFMIISYFAEAVSFPYCSLNAHQPRWIHFSKIYIAVSAVVQPNHILKAINGNLVGLCNIDGIECTKKSIATTDTNDCFLKLAIQPEVAPCFGIGLVRGIDIEQEKIYVTTPITNECLEKVNCLSLGNINVPSSFYLNQKYINVPPVYTDVRGARNVRSIKYQFKYLPQVHKYKVK